MKNLGRPLFAALFFSFVLTTVLGTVSHEIGHYLVAKHFGYNARINYAYTYWDPMCPNEIVSPENSFYIAAAGSLQTMLTGTLGVVALFFFRNSFKKRDKLFWWQWTVVFIALFWLRQSANLFTWLGGYFLKGNFSDEGDEIQMADYLGFPSWLILLATAGIGLCVLTIIIFRFIPVQQRLTFIMAGITGGITGYTLWLHAFGKYIMP